MHDAGRAPADPREVDAIVTSTWAALPASVKAARAFVADTVARSTVAHLSTVAALVVSELATNAVLHARTPFTVTVQLLPDAVLLRVRDDSGVLPVAVVPSALGGRGLHLVGSLSRAWGLPIGLDAKAVWALVTDPEQGVPVRG